MLLVHDFAGASTAEIRKDDIDAYMQAGALFILKDGADSVDARRRPAAIMRVAGGKQIMATLLGEQLDIAEYFMETASDKIQKVRVFMGIHTMGESNPALMGNVVNYPNGPGAQGKALLACINQTISIGEKQTRYTAIVAPIIGTNDGVGITGGHKFDALTQVALSHVTVVLPLEKASSQVTKKLGEALAEHPCDR